MLKDCWSIVKPFLKVRFTIVERLLNIVEWLLNNSYWWKQSSRFSSFWGPEFRKPRFRGHLAFFKSFFSILEARKFNFCWVFTTRQKKPRVQDYQASCEQILRILASLKCDFWRFMKPTFQGTSQWVKIFLIFEA